MTILDNLINMREDVLEIQERMEENHLSNERLEKGNNPDYESDKQPMIITWTLDEKPDTMFTLIISELEPELIDFHSSEIIH